MHRFEQGGRRRAARLCTSLRIVTPFLRGGMHIRSGTIGPERMNVGNANAIIVVLFATVGSLGSAWISARYGRKSEQTASQPVAEHGVRQQPPSKELWWKQPRRIATYNFVGAAIVLINGAILFSDAEYGFATIVIAEGVFMLGLACWFYMYRLPHSK